MPPTVTALLEARARSSPDAPLVHCENESWTNAQMWDWAGRIGGGLTSVGVGKGTHVALLLENEPLFYAVWFGLARLGAVEVPINTAFFGESLRHVLTDSDAEVLVVGEAGLDALASLDEIPARLHTVVVAGTTGSLPDTCQHCNIVAIDDLSGELPTTEVQPLDPLAVMYTSGTTGVSKGVVLCHRYFLLVASANVAAMRLGPGDRYLTCLPLFHGMAQLSGTMAPLLAGGDIVLVRRFSVSRFWETCHAHQVTAFGAIAAMPAMLQAAPTTPLDREHAVRYGFAVAVPAAIHRPFEERFGVRLVGGYGLTEASMITYCDYDERVPGTAGRAVPHFEVAVHDDDDERLPPGQVGEIVCRPLTHGAIMSGYYGRPEDTIETFRNLWLHTGDLGRLDEHGVLTFVDRAKDAIRRRGENISSFEVEAAVLRHPAVAEVAAYAVPSELGEDEVMLAVVPSGTVTAVEIAEHCMSVLPRYAVPTYVRFLEQMPYTPTNKVRKGELRSAGVTADTWQVGA
jgi:crotonobetaine/carnitine-CoA ligase